MKILIRKSFLVTTDIIGINISLLLALILHYEGYIPKERLNGFLGICIIVTIAKLLIYKKFQLYDSVWEYASIEELIKIVGAVAFGAVVVIAYTISLGKAYYFGVYLTAFLFEVFFIGTIRFGYRIIRRIKKHQSITQQNETKHVLIIGSGSTACMITTEIKNHPDVHGRVIGFIDNDIVKLNKTIAGIRVLGNYDDIYSVAVRYSVTEIILAVPTLKTQEMKDIMVECKRTEAKVRILPGVREIIDGQVSMSKIRDVEIEDLLGRDPVDLDVKGIMSYIEDQVILVTGGGGSIGSELCRQILRYHPKKLVVIDIYENNVYELQNELLREYPQQDLDVLIASVRDRDTMFDIIQKEKPHVIFHAAAHKHVPLMERSPKEAIKNNTIGTLNVAEAAKEFGVKRFILISTDKAVNPTNVMGASKRMCELIIQGLAKTTTTTKFSAVRFGNVLGSNGSVIPLFKRQIDAGGPVTVTHKEIIRFFMSITEASQLIIQAGAITKGGEIFVLDMGEPVRIYDLACDLIKLSGLKPFEDIDIVITGLRPGEKLYEELLLENETLVPTSYDKIHIGQFEETDYKVLMKNFDELSRLLKDGETDELMDLIRHIVPNYRDSTEVNQESKHLIEPDDRYRLAGR